MFNLKLFKCSNPLLSFMPSRSRVRFGEGIKNLGLCRGFFEANSVGALGKEERWRGLGEEQRERGFEGQHRERGLGEEETGLCFGEDERERCFGELEKGKGEASLWDCARGLLLAANPVAWMTLMCFWLSSSAVLQFWRNSAEDCGRPAGWDEDWRRYEELRETMSRWLSWVEFPSAEEGLFFLFSEVFCVSRWVGGWGKMGRRQHVMSAPTEMLTVAAQSATAAHTSSFPPTSMAAFDNPTSLYFTATPSLFWHKTLQNPFKLSFNSETQWGRDLFF